MMRLLTIALTVLALTTHDAWAQQNTPRIDVVIDTGPHYVDVPVRMMVVVQGVEEGERPDVTAPEIDGAELVLETVRNGTTRRMQVVNGQMSQWVSVRFDFVYQLTPRRDGPITVGPFTARQGSVTLTSEPTSLSAGELPESDQHFIRLVLPDTPIWVSRPFTMKVEWWLSSEFAGRLGQREMQVPMLDLDKVFQFATPAVHDSRMEMAIATATGTRTYPGVIRSEQRNGEQWLVVTIEQTVTPLRAGRHDIPAATIVVEEAIRWKRNIFGERIPSQSRRVSATDEPRVLEVLGAPATGRPADYSGAIGSGLSLEVTANRTVVNAGEPIELSLTVRGDTVLETLSLPPALAMGLDADQFSLTSNPDAGLIFAEAKTFTMTVRPRSADVTEVPALSLSWFDPDSGRFETTRSAPVALSVEASRTVGAADVLRSGNAADESDPAGATAPAPAPPPSAGATLLNQADLAIETRPERLQIRPAPWYSSGAALVAAHLVAFALALGGFWLARSRRADPAVRTQRQAVAALRARLTGAGTHAELATVLRDIVRAGVTSQRDEIDHLLAQCDAVAWQPGSTTDDILPDGIRSRAGQIAAQLEVNR